MRRDLRLVGYSGNNKSSIYLLSIGTYIGTTSSAILLNSTARYCRETKYLGFYRIQVFPTPALDSIATTHPRFQFPSLISLALTPIPLSFYSSGVASGVQALRGWRFKQLTFFILFLPLRGTC